MIDYDKSEPLISIHIPKSGGKSLTTWLEESFPDKLRLHYFDEQGNTRPQKQEWQPGILIHGHFNRRRGFGIEDYYPQARQFITFLRDPFEILVSRFFYEKQMAIEGRSFREGAPLHLDDDVDLYLAREIEKPDYHPNILDYMPGEPDLDNYRKILHNYFVYIGVLEDYQFCIDRLAERLKIPTRQVARLNQAPRTTGNNPELKERFMAAHPLEYAIYNYVLENYKNW